MILFLVLYFYHWCSRHDFVCRKKFNNYTGRLCVKEEKEALEINVEPGEYPFPVLDGPDESRYLTWVRNNANYMAVHGFLDYMRAVGVLVRGIIINFVVLLPFALAMSIAVAWWYQYTDPFVLTFKVVMIAAAVILLYPLLTPLWNIFRHRKRLETGSDSSVKPRSRLEQLFGVLLLLVLVIAAFELMAASLEPLNRLVYESERNWKLFFSVMPAALAIFATADKLLANLAGLARKLMLVFIGVLGVIVPLFFILLVSDYLVFSPPIYSEDFVFYALAIPAIMALMICVAFIMLSLGWLRSWLTKNSNVFTFKDVSKMIWFFGGLVLYSIIALIVLALSEAYLDEEYSKPLYYFWEEIDDDIWEPDESYSRVIENSEESEGSKDLRWLKEKVLGVLTKKNDESLNSANLRTEKLYADIDNFLTSVGDRASTPSLSLLFERLTDVRESYLYDEEHTEIEDTGYDNAESGLQCFQLSCGYLLSIEDRGDLAWGLVFDYEYRLRIEYLDFAENLDCEFTYDGMQIEPDELQAELIHTFLRPKSESSGVRFDEENELCLEQIREYSESPEGRQMKEYLAAYISAAHNWRVDTIEDCYKPHNSCDPHVFFSDLEKAYKELTLLAVYHSRDYPLLFNNDAAVAIRNISFLLNVLLIGLIAVPLALITRFTVDINLTSIHGLYRDRLASAFLVGADTKGDVDIEKDLDMGDICRHEAGSTAPYHLINVALNLQGSKSMGVRDRKADFFIFSKKFIGGHRTGYCRGETMELFFPQMGLATAMAISAAAASPNMGRSTSPALVIIMTLFNIRLGYWLPNPKRLETWLYKQSGFGGKDGGYVFDDVFAEELLEISRRWDQAYKPQERYKSSRYLPTVENSLVGVGFSGGGIRSATINLGITQALEKYGAFKHIDYMSTVSGGGYLGSSISALMRQKTKTESEATGKVDISKSEDGDTVVTVTPINRRFSLLRKSQDANQSYTYQYADYASLAVRQGDIVRKGQRLLNPTEVVDAKNLSFSPYYSWRVPPKTLLREIAGKLTEESKWVNVSDGGHIENLAGIELLRRRCKYIVIGDGEADPEHHFNGLAILIQTARIDLGVHIDIKAEPLRLNKKGLSKAHWVAGRIHYPGEEEKGYLLYLKSSLIGDEDEVIKHYKKTQPSFPHESTADQFFGEGQFEAYRSLGQHIGESLFEKSDSNEEQAEPDKKKTMSFVEFEEWFKGLSPDT